MTTGHAGDDAAVLAGLRAGKSVRAIVVDPYGATGWGRMIAVCSARRARRRGAGTGMSREP